MSDLIAWALERWPFAVLVLLALGFLYGGLLFDWGPEVIRPVSAQSVTQQIRIARSDVLAQVGTVQGQLATISSQSKDIQDQAAADRLDRLEQQLLWWRQQNCKSKGQARNYAWQKMGDLKASYRKITGAEWEMPTCSDIGE